MAGEYSGSGFEPRAFGLGRTVCRFWTLATRENIMPAILTMMKISGKTTPVVLTRMKLVMMEMLVTRMTMMLLAITLVFVSIFQYTREI